MESIDQMSGFVMVLWKAIYELKSEHVICGKHFPTFGLHQSTKSSLYDQSKSSVPSRSWLKLVGVKKYEIREEICEGQPQNWVLSLLR